MTHNDRAVRALGETPALVVRLLRRRGMASRAELTQQCGVTPAAMSMIIRQLVEAGIICEGERRRGGRGAPQIELSLNTDVGHALGVHATLREISLALLDFKGCLLAESRCSGYFGNFVEVCSTISTLSERMRSDSGRSGIGLIGAGVALPTRFHNPENGLDLAQEIVSWKGSDLLGTLQKTLGCDVHIENDANAAALGELSLGNSAGYSDFTYLYLSEGIGSGLVLNSSLYRGYLGNAGEVGALYPRGGSRPSFEDLINFYQSCGIAPPSRDSGQWTEFLASNQAVTDRWLARALPQVRQIAHLLTSTVAPEAIYIGGSLPHVLRQAIVKDLNSVRLTDRGTRETYQPDFVMPEIDSQDAVAFGAAASVLHRS